MSNIAIRTEGLSKRYRIGKEAERHDNLRDAIAHAMRFPIRNLQKLRRLSRFKDDETDVIWALRDITFEVPHGEVLGIVGRNGAGKSTLLKLLSRITEPTSGRAMVYGRVGSLLEVGTGFHPELTGRENVYLNGSILGMDRAYIDRTFDEIVAFAGVERFIDTAVKRYSSGMYLRLAFAVAAHLEPDVLFIDEVLAVGDAAFQKKCLDKMGAVAREGRTVLFVSHNLAALQTLCERAIWIDGGRLRETGPSEQVVDSYLRALEQGTGTAALLESEDGSLVVERVVLRDGAGRECTAFKPGDPVTVDVHYHARRDIERPYLFVGVRNHHGTLFAANMLLDGARPERLSGRGRLRCTFHELGLLPRQSYTVLFGGRKADGNSALFQAGEIGHLHVVGSAADLGWDAEPAEGVVRGSAPIIVPYTWEHPDGTSYTFTPPYKHGVPS